MSSTSDGSGRLICGDSCGAAPRKRRVVKEGPSTLRAKYCVLSRLSNILHLLFGTCMLVSPADLRPMIGAAGGLGRSSCCSTVRSSGNNLSSISIHHQPAYVKGYATILPLRKR